MALNPRIEDWQGRRVWLIGASSGIGEHLALALAARGARLALSARREDRLRALAQRCAGAQVEALDVTAAGEIAAAAERVAAALGPPDLVVFNAGTYRPTRAWELDPTRVRETLEVNLLAVFDGLAAVLPGMVGRSAGGVALVASVAGYGGLPRASVYGPSKAALINLAETLYLDLSPKGLGVWLIDPGFVDTPLTRQNDFRMPALIGADQAARRIVEGFASGAFEIHFPRRFTWVLKLLRMLPYRWYFPLIRRATGG